MIGSSLALTAMAQQDQPTSPAPTNAPTKKEKKEAKAEQQAPAQPQQGQGQNPQDGNKAERKADRAQMRAERKAGANTPDASGNANPNVNANANGNEPMRGKHNKRERAARNEAAATAASPGASVAAEQTNMANGNGKHGNKAERKAEKMNARANQPTMTPAMAPAANAQPATNAQTGANLQTTQGGKTGLAGPAKIQQGTVGKDGKSANIQVIKTQQANFRAQPLPQQIPSVTFNQGYRIQGAAGWQGPQYEVYRSYHPEMHDQAFYRSRYNRVEVIGGGAYYFNSGYWYPAWGYDNSAAYYPYDGPIYVGAAGRNPDQVIAEVQSALQQMGYYRGEVDGLVGPLTRQALTGYQEDHGLYATATIDEPTLDALDLG